jgi:hypothetical protein
LWRRVCPAELNVGLAAANASGRDGIVAVGIAAAEAKANGGTIQVSNINHGGNTGKVIVVGNCFYTMVEQYPAALSRPLSGGPGLPSLSRRVVPRPRGMPSQTKSSPSTIGTIVGVANLALRAFGALSREAHTPA